MIDSKGLQCLKVLDRKPFFPFFVLSRGLLHPPKKAVSLSRFPAFSGPDVKTEAVPVSPAILRF